jgi:pyruvate dehydrogenase E1 component alpha subunit
VVDGQDVLVMHAAMERAVQRARSEEQPTLLEVRTYRFMGHSMSDPIHGHYRTREEVEDQRKRDPIAVWSQRLIAEELMDEAAVRAMDKSVVEEVEDAYQFADQAPDPEPEALFADVYAEEQREE